MHRRVKWILSSVLVLLGNGLIWYLRYDSSNVVMPEPRHVDNSGLLSTEELKINQMMLRQSVLARRNISAFTDSNRINTSETTPRTLFLSNEQIIKNKMIQMATKIYKAKLHARGTKTSDNLHEAIKTMEDIFDILQIDIDSLKNRRTVQANGICPEIYTGRDYGYLTTNCSYGKPLSTLVTILAYCKGTSISTIVSFIESVYAKNEHYKILIALNNKQMISKVKKAFPKVVCILYKITYVGKALNTLVNFVKTPYVFIARDVEFFTDDARIERLVRDIESIQVAVVAGAHRTPDGHWRKGCYQSVYRNYTLQCAQGYDESIHECIFCDYVTGPFVASTKISKTYKFSQLSDDQGLFEDWFLKLTQHQKEIVACPDSMFHTRHAEEAKTHWNLLMEKWDLYKLVTPHEQTFIKDCQTLPEWFLPATRASHPCYLQSCADTIKFVAQKCETNNITYAVVAGTQMGALKMGKVLPWEVDVDIPMVPTALVDFKKFSSIFQTNGYKTRLFKKPGPIWNNAGGGGAMHITGRHYKVDTYGRPDMDPDRMLKEGFVPTKVIIDGTWVVAEYRNPGLKARNIYKDLYRHAVHYQATGGNTRSKYNTNTTLTCKYPGHHNCLDRYNADGNLQFTYILP